MGTNFDILDSLVDSFLKSSGMKEREFANWVYVRLGKSLSPKSCIAGIIYRVGIMFHINQSL